MAEDMKAQVTVSIEDKLSQPLKDMVKVVELMDKSVQAMGAQFGSLADTLLNAAGEFTALLTPIQDAEDSVSALGDTMHGLRIHIKDVEDRLKASENAYGKAEQRIDKLEAQIAELSAAMQNLTESHEQANGRIQELTGQMEEMREEQERVAEAAREAEEAERSFQARLEKLQSVGEGMMKFGAALAAPAAGLSALATKAVNAYAEVQKGEVRFRNTFEVSKNPQEDEARMKEAVALAEKLGVSLPGSTSDMLDMFSALREQGVTMDQVLHGTGEAAANFATVMGVGFEQSAVMMSKFSEALDMPASQATELVDILQRLKGASGLTVDDLYGTFSYLGSTLKTLKVGGKDAAKEISALLTIMGGAGIEGSRAGTGLAGAMSAMANVKEKINSKGFQEKFGREFAAKGIELSFFDKSGQFIGTKKMFMELQKLKKLDDQKQLQVLTELFGEASARPMAALVAAGEKGYNEAVKKMELQKNTQTKIKEIMGTISMSWESLQGTIDTLTATVGKHINQAFGQDGIAGVINKVNDFISDNIIGWINVHPKEVQEIIKSFADIPKLLTPLWDRLKEIGAWFKDPQTGEWIEANNKRLVGIMKTVVKLAGAGALIGPVITAAGSGLVAVSAALGSVTVAGKFVSSTFGNIFKLSPQSKTTLDLVRKIFNAKSFSWATRIKDIVRILSVTPRLIQIVSLFKRATVAGMAFYVALKLIQKYWGNIKAFFEGFVQGFMGKFGDLEAAAERVKIAFEPVLAMIDQALDWLLGKPSKGSEADSLVNGYNMGDTFAKFLELILKIIENVGYLAKAFMDTFADIGRNLAMTWNWITARYYDALTMLQTLGLLQDVYNPDNNFGAAAQGRQYLPSEVIKQQSREAQWQGHLQREAEQKQASEELDKIINRKTSNLSDRIEQERQFSEWFAKYAPKEEPKSYLTQGSKRETFSQPVSNTVNNTDYSKTSYTLNMTVTQADPAQIDKQFRKFAHEQERKSFVGAKQSFIGAKPAYIGSR